MKVEQLMTRAPRTCTTTDTLHRVANSLWEGDCGVIPIVDAHGRLRGMLTDRDVCMASYTQGRALHEIQAEQVMSKMIFTLAPGDAIPTAVALFRERKVRRAPVVDDSGTLVGILSISDLVHASSSGRLAHDVRPDAVFEAVHSVSKPRKSEHAPLAQTLTKSAQVELAPKSPLPASAPAAATPSTPASAKLARKDARRGSNRAK